MVIGSSAKKGFMSKLSFPEFLDFPDKLLPLLDPDVFNKYTYFVIEGGRGSGKTQSVARFLLYLAEQYSLRIVAAREQQNSIEDSVYAVFSDLIHKYKLFFDTPKTKISHRATGSTIGFKGMREQGAVNIKGMENVDIVWFEEAQSASKGTLDILLPTIRKNNAKLFFTLNRYVRNDPVMSLVGQKDCLHIHIDHFENKHCTLSLKNQAESCKNRNEKDYNHIWLGQPLDVTEEFLFNFSKLDKAKTLEPFGDLFYKQKVMAVDFAGGGGDLCMAKLLERRSNVHWENTKEVGWSDPDTDLSVGKTISLYGEWQPDVLIVDAGGLGYPMFITISKTIKDVIGFDGASASRQPNTGNARADGFFSLKEYFDREWLICKSQYTINECEWIKKKYHVNGKIYIQDKKQIRIDNNGASPDRVDALMMGVYAIRYYLGKMATDSEKKSNKPIRTNKPKRR